MRHRARWGVPALLTLALSLLSCVEAAPLDRHELTGRVTVLLESGEAGAGIADARVTFVSDTLLTARATTDADGRYRLRVETDHEFGQVRAEADGFRAHEETVYFDSAQRRVDLALRRQAP